MNRVTAVEPRAHCISLPMPCCEIRLQSCSLSQGCILQSQQQHGAALRGGAEAGVQNTKGSPTISAIRPHPAGACSRATARRVTAAERLLLVLTRRVGKRMSITHAGEGSDQLQAVINAFAFRSRSTKKEKAMIAKAAHAQQPKCANMIEAGRRHRGFRTSCQHSLARTEGSRSPSLRNNSTLTAEQAAGWTGALIGTALALDSGMRN